MTEKENRGFFGGGHPQHRPAGSLLLAPILFHHLFPRGNEQWQWLLPRRPNAAICMKSDTECWELVVAALTTDKELQLLVEEKRRY